MNDYKELIENLQEITERGTGCKFDVVRLNCMENAVDAIEQLIKERDAAIADISWLIINHYVCGICKHHDDDDSSHCGTCGVWIPNGNFEWRGVTDDN